MEEKDLKSLNIRTDLVTDIIPNINTTVNEETYEENNIRVSNIFLDSKSSKLIESGTQNIDKILKVANDSLGLDLKSLIAGFAAKSMIDKKEEN